MQLLKRPEVGVGVLIVRDDKVLLGKRLGAHGEGYYAPPGGHIEAGESVAQTARREVREETGLEIADIRLVSVGSYCIGENHYYVDVDVVCQSYYGEALNLEPDRCAGWGWYDLDHLPQPLFIVAERIIASYRTGIVVADIDAVYRQPYRVEDEREK
ncbi:MAG: nucleotide triphosphate diphosphatase NUDT15 [Anaerolineae bacterium]